MPPGSVSGSGMRHEDVMSDADGDVSVIDGTGHDRCRALVSAARGARIRAAAPMPENVAMRLRDTPERRLIQLLCSTADTRRAGLGEMSACCTRSTSVGCWRCSSGRGSSSWSAGGCSRWAGRDIPELERELDVVQRRTRAGGEQQRNSPVSRSWTGLTTAGIRALPLKGSLLARELYGDVGARSFIDVDVLVAPENLRDAVRVLSWARLALGADVSAGGRPADTP